VDSDESVSTDIPVLLGDRREATIGAGMVRLLRYFGVFVIPVVEVRFVGVRGRSPEAC
jgi:hypothetical protein